MKNTLCNSDHLQSRKDEFKLEGRHLRSGENLLIKRNKMFFGSLDIEKKAKKD